MSGVDRRQMMSGAGALAASAVLPGPAAAQAFASKRPPKAERRFTSPAVEAEIRRVTAKIADPELRWLFENCYPNTLDTTVTRVGVVDGKPDAFVITGDIPALWLRDSSAQLQTYVHLTPKDANLRRLFRGLIQRQARSILIDPYANAFMEDPSAPSNLGARTDRTDMKPGVAERKWEIDSLCYAMRLSHEYWAHARDKTPFDETWARAMALAVDTFRIQQRKAGKGPYHFQRVDPSPTETLMWGGYGWPTREVGLIHSGFRPSDDACVYPFLIPSNLFAGSALRMLARVHREARGDSAAAGACEALAAEVDAALQAHGRMPDGQGGEVWAFEVDGYGNAIFMDDANVPSLSALPLIGAANRDDPLYRRTAALAWSRRNPYFFEGTAGQGIGGPHAGEDQIWPMSIIVRALMADDDATIRQCLTWLKATHAGTGFMHESFNKDDPAKFTRSWFAWANGLFGDLILDLERRRPALLAQTY